MKRDRAVAFQYLGSRAQRLGRQEPPSRPAGPPGGQSRVPARPSKSRLLMTKKHCCV